MKKLISVMLALAMVCSFGVMNARAEEWKPYITAMDSRGNVYEKDGETLSIADGEKVFVYFLTDFEHNEENGVDNVTGFSDGYPGGTLSAAGFQIKTGTAKELGYKGSSFGLEIGTGSLKPGKTSVLNYFLYEKLASNSVPSEQDGGFDFVNTPHVLDQWLTVKVVPKTMKISSLKAGKKSLTVKWKKQKDITGYEIQYSTKKDFSSGVKTVKVKSAKKTSRKLKGLKAKKKYYVRIRSYKKIAGGCCSEWSRVKTKKTK